MSGRNEPPLTKGLGQSAFVRNNDKEDATSIISMAKSLLADSKLNSNVQQQNQAIYPVVNAANGE